MKKLTNLIIFAWMSLACFGQKITGITATASTGTASLAVDDNVNTRWESAFSDPQWISLDLGMEYNVSKVIIRWEAANAKDYTLEGSTDGINWIVIQTLQNMPGGNRIDTLKNINTNYRYIKVNGTARNLNYGYSIWEIEVYQVAVPVLSSLVIVPQTKQCYTGDTVFFTAVGLDQNNDPYPLSGATTWSVSDSGAVIDSQGRFIAMKPGFYTVSAEYDTFTAQSKVDVLPVETNICSYARAYASTGNAMLAIDGNGNTRWESAFSDPQWLLLALDTIRRIYGFRIEWEAANAKDYVVEGSVDSINWTLIVQKNNMPAGSRIDVAYDLNNADYKYIRLTGTSRNLAYGYSIWEFKVYERRKELPVVSWSNPVPITYGTLLGNAQLNAEANVPGTFVYYPSSGTLLNAGVHKLYTRFYPSDPLTYSQVIDSVTLIVNKVNPIINWDNPDTIVYGTLLSAQQLNATVSNAIDGQFFYTPSENTKLEAGMHTLKVSFVPSDTLNYLTVSDSVIIVVRKAVPTITWETPAAITYGEPISTVQLSANVEGFTGTFSYSVAIGTRLDAGFHILSVIFYPDDSANVEVVSKSVQLVVKKAIPTLQWNLPAVFSYGRKLAEWPITTSITGMISCSLPIDSLLPVGQYTQVVNFVPDDTANYTSVLDTVLFTIEKAIPTLKWNNPAPIVYGTPLSAAQLNATCEDVQGTISYSVKIDSVLSAGQHQMVATFTPEDTINYTVVEKSVVLEVLKAVPVINISLPDSIIEGTVLTSALINATASIAGTFSYDPDTGTVLSAGTHLITIIFVPADTANYMTVTSEAEIVVSPKTLVSNIEVEQISIFPNPCVEYISVASVGSRQLKIFDINGRLVRVEQLFNGNNVINVLDLSPGMYYFNVNGSVCKVIKQ